MAKLHELLAVRGNLAGQATKTSNELAGTLRGKRHHFEETLKTFTSNEPDKPKETIEQKDIQTTVIDEINWVKPYLAAAVDVAYQIDVANMTAVADVVTSTGKTVLQGVPATTLLQLEKRVQEWKSLIEAIPTLDPAKGFAADPNRGPGYFKARDVEKVKTKKTKQVLKVAPPTDKHPEQTLVYDEDVPVGKILEQEWSSLITPAKKAELLDKVESLYRAVTTARAKANEYSIDTEDKKIGDTLLAYIFEPLSAA